MKSYKSYIKQIHINKFRALNDATINLGERITVICGKNGTSKSSILGIAGQVFNFQKDYTTNKQLSFKQINEKQFKSKFAEHFKLSKEYDKAGSLDVKITVVDGYSNKFATAKLEFVNRADGNGLPRAVLRNNSIATTNKSRNFTHPVIHLSLKRLLPIASRTYKKIDSKYIQNPDHLQQFTMYFSEILNKQNYKKVTATDGSIFSAAAHSTDYDESSVSAGEDNIGQIILAIMSFEKLKNEYDDYKGGLLLIDEVDAALFPAAQINLYKLLRRIAGELKLQIIMTTHSTYLMEYSLTQRDKANYKTVYLSDYSGHLCVEENWTWERIYADITFNAKKPKQYNVYLEDNEASVFFNHLTKSVTDKTYAVQSLRLGKNEYFKLISHNIKEFSKFSLICIDDDGDENDDKYENVILLPGGLPPDQLIFQFLFNLPDSDDIWKNSLHLTRYWFTDLDVTKNIIRTLKINSNTIDLTSVKMEFKANTPSHKGIIRDLFKKFITDPDISKFLSLSHNAWELWCEKKPTDVAAFCEKLSQLSDKFYKESYESNI